jgi:hypothetical protein
MAFLGPFASADASSLPRRRTLMARGGLVALLLGALSSGTACGALLDLDLDWGDGECPFQQDGDCDEPEGTDLCDEGTDRYDCAGAPQTPPSGACPWVEDGWCDEPEGTGWCAEGSDVVDCASFCATPCDGVCDEPEGSGSCPDGSDPLDCIGHGEEGGQMDDGGQSDGEPDGGESEGDDGSTDGEPVLPCAELDEAACEANPDCRPLYARPAVADPALCWGSTEFVGCVESDVACADVETTWCSPAAPTELADYVTAIACAPAGWLECEAASCGET